jgi:hypothetical protein
VIPKYNDLNIQNNQVTLNQYLNIIPERQGVHSTTKLQVLNMNSKQLIKNRLLKSRNRVLNENANNTI